MHSKHEPQQSEVEGYIQQGDTDDPHLHNSGIIYNSKMEEGSENYKVLYFSLKTQYESLASDR